MLYKLVSLLLNTILIKVVSIRSGQESSNTISSAIIVQSFSGCTQKSKHPVNNTGLHISLSVEQICLSVDFVCSAGLSVKRCISVITGSVPVTEASCISYPDACSDASVIKCELYSIVCILFTVNAGECCSIKIVPILINSDPSGCKHTTKNVIVNAINGVESVRCVNIAASTNNLVANNLMVVSCCRNNSTPVNYGSTACAVSASGITVYLTSCCLISNCLSIMLMPNGLVVQLGCYVEISVETGDVIVIGATCVSNGTIESFTLNINDGNCSCLKLVSCGNAGFFFIPCPYANRNRSKNSITTE